ncbi:MAG: hypothetical protein NVS2B8_19720 [Vulcanimicrobiaceae bacterium]
MSIHDFMRYADGPVRIQLVDGTVHTGRFRTDILTPTALSAYFHGDIRDMSLPIEIVVAIESLNCKAA